MSKHIWLYQSWIGKESCTFCGVKRTEHNMDSECQVRMVQPARKPPTVTFKMDQAYSEMLGVPFHFNGEFVGRVVSLETKEDGVWATVELTTPVGEG